MNEPPRERLEDETPGSPKRKKVRAKYASRACVSCRRSKLKCSGENPCQRCLDNARRCFYSEDQTAAEVLTNLSRPTPVQPPLNANGNGGLRRNIMPRQDGTGMERRASDACVLSMEARMTRIENMMEALRQERGGGMTPRGSMERDDLVSESLQGDASFDMPLDPLGAAARSLFGLQHELVDTRPRHSTSAASPLSHGERSSIKIGLRDFVFPNVSDYQKYVDFFFTEVNPHLPCVNEAEFRFQSEQLPISGDIPSSQTCFLALNYAIFACVDSLVDIIRPEVNIPGIVPSAPGWQWFQAADELIGKRDIIGRGNLMVIQALLLESFYLTSADKPNAVYNTIGLACRLCFQSDLHQQAKWNNCTEFEIHMRQRIFWSLYITDRRIALSCGRPYGIRDIDVDVEQPSYIYDRDLYPDQPLPNPDFSRSANVYLRCMIAWGKLAGDVWDQAFAAAATKHGIDEERTANLDARINHFTQVTLPKMPPIASEHSPEDQQLRHHALVYARFNYLRLLLRRHEMLSLKYDPSTGRLCGDLAVDTIKHIKNHIHDGRILGACRFHIAIALAGPLLILISLLVRDIYVIGLQDRLSIYIEAFREAIAILSDLSAQVQVAHRIMVDFQDAIRTVNANLSNMDTGIMGWMEQRFTPEDFPVRLQITSLSKLSAPADSWDAEFQQGNAKEYGVVWI